jgi:hypothetical protein
MPATKQLAKLSAPQIGEMLIAGEYIIPQDLDFALDHQRYSKDPIGEILIRMGAVERRELERILNLQKAISER